MRTLFILVLTLASSFSFALGKVGDKANYKVTIESDDQTTVKTVSDEIVSFSAATKKFLVREATVANGKTQIQEKETDRVFVDEVARRIISTCETPLETITVPAGEFVTCKITQSSDGNSSTYRIGAVPFGVVKMEMNYLYGTTEKMELVSFDEAP